MSDYTRHNLKDVENAAQKFGMPSELEARFARRVLGGESLGLSHSRAAADLRPGVRLVSDPGSELSLTPPVA